MTQSIAGSRVYRSATQGRATRAMCACGKTWRTVRMAGKDITASPSQLVARTNTFDMEDGLKATFSRIAARALRTSPRGGASGATLLAWAAKGSDRQEQDHRRDAETPRKRIQSQNPRAQRGPRECGLDAQPPWRGNGSRLSLGGGKRFRNPARTRDLPLTVLRCKTAGSADPALNAEKSIYNL